MSSSFEWLLISFLISIFQVTKAWHVEEKSKVQRQGNQVVGEIFKVTRWMSLGRQEKNSKGIICRNNGLCLLQTAFWKDKLTLGNIAAFFLNSLFSVSHPFTSYTMYCFNFMLASKNRGKACKVCSLPECLAEECQRMAKYSHRLGYQSNVHYPMQWLNFPSPTLCLFLSMPRENKDFS